MVDALARLARMIASTSSARAIARLAALHVDDRAERALERAAAPGVEAGHGPAGALDAARPAGSGSARFERRQVVHVIVERLQLAGVGVAQHASSRPSASPANRLTPSACASLQVGRNLRQHGEAARDMEAADGDLTPCGAQAAARCRSARGNWLDCTPTRQTSPRPPLARSTSAICSGRTRVLVSSIGEDVDVDVGPEHAARRAQSAASPCRTASEFDGIAERSHWMT